MTTDRKLDDAARAAWLSYISGLKQEEIAALMGVSRQTAQRLVSQAVSAGLVKVRIDHPIGACMELSRRIADRYGIACDVVPTLGPGATHAAVGTAAATQIERWLARPDPIVIGLGTGRTLQTAVDLLPQIDCAQHKIVSLTGNIAPDGSTAYYNVLFSVADRVTAATFPIPLPVIAATTEERDALIGQKTLAATRALSERTDVRFIGIGTMGEDAPLVRDGFLTPADRDRLLAKGAVGEVIGRVYDAAGEPLQDEINARVSSAETPHAPPCPTIAAAWGADKVGPIRGAMAGRLITGLVTDEDTARALLENA
ncbi:sugar-binding transcriptional regulator [Wenxinia saemankumensis]|uniref:DNA-binding transcriptional regulator LsrR, DeoR family n=1 Tax=Wenxinia saemankumensis TaxID=1447782 RepID=A0A1M6EL46_9RHOB|nr:sugar-binding transcriptional regulator [Wenxinia saemankumensis]SHI86008.1 DNA-binding transcriptional regulator LsrR, DeoR family [Wenxinia saemankumensis]